MGIRFEYGSRKATNGPMIFFSDPISDINLQEEIRGSIESRLSFYAYRMPGDSMVSFGSSEGTVDGLGQSGFIIAPFLPDRKIITIPYAPTPRTNLSEEFPFPTRSTTEDEYLKEIDVIHNYIGDSDDRKVVAARVKVDFSEIDVASTFLNLVKTYPDAYVFCFSTPSTGCWIGATPELLLKSHNGGLQTMALAGTRAVNSPEDWDDKNIREQSMVTQYIETGMRDLGLTTTIGNTYTRKAGNVEHLCTPIVIENPVVIENPDKPLLPDELERLLRSLSPTPATAGLPRKEALKIINETESFSRGYYGGFCGPFRSTQEFTFFVNLRCARIETGRAALFAGGGITGKSIPDKEWEETQMKLATLLKVLESPSSSYL